MSTVSSDSTTVRNLLTYSWIRAIQLYLSGHTVQLRMLSQVEELSTF